MNENNDISKFNSGDLDFGNSPPSYELSIDQKKLAALAMAIQATVVQFVNEGLFDPTQQVHFMGHLQDFINRLYIGETMNLPNTKQTLQINSKVGNLFFEATNGAFTEGSARWAKIKEMSQEAAKQAERSNVTEDAKPKYLN